MVTKSIVGRFLVLAVLLASFGVIGQAAYKIAQQPARTVARLEPAAPRADLAPPAPAKRDITPAVFVPAADAAAPAPADAAPVRVVYPGPLGDAPAQPRKALEMAAASPPPPAAPAASPPPAAQPQAPAVAAAPAVKPVEVASAEPAVGLPAAQTAAPAPAAGKGVNLNNASTDALNRLGGGRIGQAIVAHRPYRSVEDLVKKRVVRRSVYDQIKDQLAAD